MNNNQNLPHIAVNAQYIKDLSFENPGAPTSFLESSEPQIELALDLKVTPLQTDFYEVLLVIEAKAKNEAQLHYIVELEYAGIFHLINIPEDQKNVVLAVHCPAMIFPFARKIIADATQGGGFQPLMIDPIDFGILYNKKLSEGTLAN